jgi:O-methyltransferase involved in polyketide biosynthesis
MIVADGLTAFLSGHAYKAMTRALTAHFSTGEFAFNAYTPLVMRLANYSPTLKARLLAVSSGFGDQVSVVPAWRVDEGVMVSLAA